jgi:mRNA-degrading endonuclease RelE of RelBE toxin-antitoxin system
MYNAHILPEVDAILKSKKKKEQEKIQRIVPVMQRLLKHPYANDYWLKGKLAGKHKKYVGKTSYRIIFAICEECRKLEHDNYYNKCEDCAEIPDKSVTFFDIIDRKEEYK